MRKTHFAIIFGTIFVLTAVALAAYSTKLIFEGEAKSVKLTKSATRTVDPPWVFCDDSTGILVYVESDRRHITAFEKDGKILWHRDVTENVVLRQWPKDPVIGSVGEAHRLSLEVMNRRGKPGEYFGISFTNKEFGALDQRTGEYTLMGSD